MPSPSTTYSPAVEAARARRTNRAALDSRRTQWFINQVSRSVNITARARVTFVTEFLRNKIVENISIPVKKEIVKGKQGRDERGRFTARTTRTVVTERSKPGEFPRADTTLLRKTIFGMVEEPIPKVYDGYIGTPIGYGVRLELHMNRSFLVRTWNEEIGRLIPALTGPMR